MEGRVYNRYRGRGSGGRPWLAALLLCVIFGSAAFVLVREQMVYDAEGNLHLRVPWARETPEEPTIDPDPELEIQPSQTPQEEPAPPRQALLLSAKPLTQEALTAAASRGESPVVTLKDASGLVYFASAAARADALRPGEDTQAALSRLTADFADAAARISCFLDPLAAQGEVEAWGLKNTGGYIFYDGDGNRWLDPGKEGARDYLLGIIREAAALGFGEILLTEVSYPTRGKLHKIDFSHGRDPEGRQENVEAFLRAVREALPEGVVLSIALDAETIRSGVQTDAGHSLAGLAPLVDRIYAPARSEEAAAFAAAVSAAAPECRFIPEVTERPADPQADFLLWEAA